MRYWVYVLRCSDNSLYTGISGNFNKRIREHFNGLVPYTKNKKPFNIFHKESFKSRTEAAAREKEIKGWNRKKKLKLLESLR